LTGFGGLGARASADEEIDRATDDEAVRTTDRSTGSLRMAASSHSDRLSGEGQPPSAR
jgi:hypothetical protein